MNRQQGYSLLEVILAFAILAMALTLLLGTLSGGMRQMRESTDAGRAVLHAQTLLETLGVETPLTPGHHTGEFEQGRYRWVLDISPYHDPALPAVRKDADNVELMEINLNVSWGAGGERQRWQLKTLRLTP